MTTRAEFIAVSDQALAKADDELAAIVHLYRQGLASMTPTEVWASLTMLLSEVGDMVSLPTWLATAVRRQVEAETATHSVPCALCGLPIPSCEATHQTCSPRVVQR
ncbi:MAG TPA: hypothetical protein VHA75_09920 [Rugosimonospora sp.]|nr:hypothetical protein [Rugosimonospora sp.]